MQINNIYSPIVSNTKIGNTSSKTLSTSVKKSISTGEGIVLDLRAHRGDELLRLIEKIFGHQTRTFNLSNGGILREDAFEFMMENISAEQAKDLISEDGFFGIERTSERLFNMALAFSGGDPEKLEEMRDAVKKGFNMAKGTMGGELPQISHDTLARTMERFDEWFASAN